MMRTCQTAKLKASVHITAHLCSSWKEKKSILLATAEPTGPLFWSVN